jgi:hypothetical protein
LAVVGATSPLVGRGLDGVPVVLRQFVTESDRPVVGQVQVLAHVSHGLILGPVLSLYLTKPNASKYLIGP